MKKFTLFLFVCLTACLLLFTSCSSKNIKVTVVGPNDEILCEQTVKLGADSETSVEGKNTFAIDLLEAALTQANIPYNINKSDVENYALTNVGDIACDEYHTFAYYIKHSGKSEFEKSNLSANYDFIESGEEIKFVYESLQ